MSYDDNLNETLKAIDDYIAEQNKLIKLGEDLKGLMADKRFQRVILDGYFETESKKLFDILTNPYSQSAIDADEVQVILAGINHFKRFVGTPDNKGTVMIEAEQAPLNIAREEDERARITAEYSRSGE